MKLISKYIAILVSVAALFTSSAVAQSISANESVTVAIRGVPQSEQGRISGQYVVSSSGYLSLPLLKNGVKASGRSASAVAKSIEAAYRDAGMYKDPRITIISNQDVSDKIARDREVISIGGFVRSPGQRPYISGMTLFQAVSAAGGETAFGSIRRVELYHKGRKSTYDMRKAVNMQIKVYPGDSINIPQKKWDGS